MHPAVRSAFLTYTLLAARGGEARAALCALLTQTLPDKEKEPPPRATKRAEATLPGVLCRPRASDRDQDLDRDRDSTVNLDRDQDRDQDHGRVA